MNRLLSRTLSVFRNLKTAVDSGTELLHPGRIHLPESHRPLYKNKEQHAFLVIAVTQRFSSGLPNLKPKLKFLNKVKPWSSGMNLFAGPAISL